MSPDGRHVIHQFDARPGLGTCGDHQLVTVFTLRSSIGVRMHRIGRADNGYRDRFW
jgi:hypothetical protein